MYIYADIYLGLLHLLQYNYFLHFIHLLKMSLAEKTENK